MAQQQKQQENGTKIPFVCLFHEKDCCLLHDSDLLRRSQLTPSPVATGATLSLGCFSTCRSILPTTVV